MEVSNVGKRWTEEEEKTLLAEVKIGLSTHEIAKKHGRTERGIRYRLLDVAYSMSTKDIDISDIATETGLDIFDIQSYVEKKKQEPVRTGSKGKNDLLLQKIEILSDRVILLHEKIDFLLRKMDDRV